MPKITLMMSTKYTDVHRGYDELDTGRMAGCVTVIVHGSHATRAQHCNGGFKFLDKDILNGIGTVKVIAIVANLINSDEHYLIYKWVDKVGGKTGRATYINSSHALINLNAMRRGGFDECLIGNLSSNLKPFNLNESNESVVESQFGRKIWRQLELIDT